MSSRYSAIISITLHCGVSVSQITQIYTDITKTDNVYYANIWLVLTRTLSDAYMYISKFTEAAVTEVANPPAHNYSTE